jgi:hypothetical protein
MTTQTAVDANLLDATARLEDAVAALTARQARSIPGAGSGWLPSRYVLLRGALEGTRGAGARRRRQPSSLLPCWVDALKLLLAIDGYAGELERCYPSGLDVRRCDHPTVFWVRGLLEYGRRPQDSRAVLEIAGELGGYARVTRSF